MIEMNDMCYSKHTRLTWIIQTILVPRAHDPSGLRQGSRALAGRRFSEHAQSIRFVFSANQICQIWREVRESRTSGVGPAQSSRSLPRARRIMSSGDENEFRHTVPYFWHAHWRWYNWFCQTTLAPVHTAPEKFEKAALFGLGLPVHANPSRKQSFSKTLFKQEEFAF